MTGYTSDKQAIQYIFTDLLKTRLDSDMYLGCAMYFGWIEEDDSTFDLLEFTTQPYTAYKDINYHGEPIDVQGKRELMQVRAFAENWAESGMAAAIIASDWLEIRWRTFSLYCSRENWKRELKSCLLYTSPSPRDA